MITAVLGAVTEQTQRVELEQLPYSTTTNFSRLGRAHWHIKVPTLHIFTFIKL